MRYLSVFKLRGGGTHSLATNRHRTAISLHCRRRNPWVMEIWIGGNLRRSETTIQRKLHRRLGNRTEIVAMLCGKRASRLSYACDNFIIPHDENPPGSRAFASIATLSPQLVTASPPRSFPQVKSLMSTRSPEQYQYPPASKAYRDPP